MKVLIRDQNGNRLVVSNPVPRGSLKTVKGETKIVVANIAPSEAISITITSPAVVASASTTSAVAGQLGRDDNLLKIGLGVLGIGGLGFAAWRIKNRCRCNCGKSCRCSCGCSASCEYVALSRVAAGTVGSAGAYGYGGDYDSPYYGHDHHHHWHDHGGSGISFDSGAIGSDAGGFSD